MSCGCTLIHRIMAKQGRVLQPAAVFVDHIHICELIESIIMEGDDLKETQGLVRLMKIKTEEQANHWATKVEISMCLKVWSTDTLHLLSH